MRIPKPKDEEFQAELDNIGLNMKEFREAKGLKQKELAGLVDLKPASISRIENGKQNPDLYSLLMIGRVLDRQLSDFFQPAAEAQGAFRNGQASEPVPDKKAVAVRSPKPP